MNKPAIGFGIVGCSMIARWHAAALAAIAQSGGAAHLIGVADQDWARATAFAAERNVRAYSSVADLVADAQIQAVCICTPNGTHAEMALTALRAGKHVLIEKPLALCVEDCDKLIEEARRQNVCAGVVSQLRFGEAIQAVRALLQSEGLGRMICAELSMRYHRESAYYQNSAWHGTREMDGGGALMNQGIHGIDLLLHLMGPAQQVWGLTATRVHSIPVEDTAVAALRFASGALGTVVATTASAPGYPRRMTLTGERGSITLTEDGLSEWQVPGVAMPNCARMEAHGAASPDGIPLRGHIAQLADFAQAIRHARPCAVTLEDGRRAYRQNGPSINQRIPNAYTMIHKEAISMNKPVLAIHGATPTIVEPAPKSLFQWPIMGEEDEAAAMEVVRENKFSGFDITERFQEEFAAWQGRKYAIAYCNGTMSLTSAMFAIGLGEGDEIICPTKTYWGSVSQANLFGASAVFCNINEMLSMDPNDLERCISPRTKAIMVVHYFGYPCDMDAIMPIARKHNLRVIEDVSHAQGGLYKGKKVGTFGDVAAMSLMSGKSFAAGELGILVTDDRGIYERAMAFGHYERNNDHYITQSEDLKPYYHIALGGAKGRANQVCSALARVQLKYYDERCAEIRKAMNHFWDLLEGLPGIRAIRVDESTGSNMAGWYSPHGAYHPEELGGLSVNRFCEAMRAEVGNIIWPGGNFCLHTHPYFKTFDLSHAGKPSRIAFNDRDVRETDAACAPSERMWCFSVPWFKHFDPEWIEKYASAFRKVIENYQELLEEAQPQNGGEKQDGRWCGMENDATQSKK